MNSPSEHSVNSPDAAVPATAVEQAIQWLICLDYNTPTQQTRADFSQWLQADSKHQQAWQRVQALKGFQHELQGLTPGVTKQVLQRAQSHRLSRRDMGRLLSLLAISLSTGLVVHQQTPWQRLVADTSTRIGERKTLDMADGNRLLLNTDTAVSLSTVEDQYRLVLHRGEILIDSASINRRPFYVETPFGEVQAASSFMVRLDSNAARVNAQQGELLLTPRRGPSETIIASEGRLLTDTGIQRWAVPDFQLDSWIDGIIAARDMRLADLLAELSRYRQGYIRCDPRIADLRVSGSFQLENTQSTLEFLAQTQSLQLTWLTRFMVIVSPQVA